MTEEDKDGFIWKDWNCAKIVASKVEYKLDDDIAKDFDFESFQQFRNGTHFEFTLDWVPLDDSFLKWLKQFPNHMDTAKYYMFQYSPEVLQEER
jgi:hypothetical protein